MQKNVRLRVGEIQIFSEACGQNDIIYKFYV